MPDTDLFKKNIERWELLYPKDAEKLKKIHCDSVDLHPNASGELNLKSTMNGQTVYYHAAGALAEAQQQFAALDLKNVSVILVYGVGLGYFYEAAKEWLQQNSTRSLVFLEDNLEVIHRLFETERGTTLLNDQQVWLAHLDPEMFILDSLAQVFVIKPYTFTALPVYQSMKSTTFDNVKAKFAFFMSLRAGVVFEYEDYGRLFFANFFRNIFDLPKAFFGNGLFDQFKGVPAIVCGAGPSLVKNLPVLETLRDRALIIAGGTAMNALNATGFLPHFGVGIDPHKAQFTRLIMNQAYEIPYFYRNRLNHESLTHLHGDHLYATGSLGYEIGDWFEDKLGIKGKNIEEGYNVVNFSVSLAHALGCNPIILVGVDLAYTDGQSYAPGVLNHPIHSRRKYFRTKTAEEELISKEDIHGQPTFTLWKWISESTWFSSFANKNPGVVVVNATEGGIGFNEIPNVPLQEVAEKLLRTPYDIQGMVVAKIQKNPLPATVTDEQIEASLKELLASLRRCYELCETVRNDFDKAEQALATSTESPSSVVSDKCVEALSALEQESAYNYVLKVFSNHFIQLFTREYQRLNFDESLLTEKEMALKRIRLNSARYKFLKETAKITMRTLEQVLEEQAEKRLLLLQRQKNRSSQASKPSQAPSEEQYAFEQGRLMIRDPELNINFDEPFVPDEIGGIKQSKYSSGTLKSEQYFLDEALHGPSSYYSENGQLLSRYWFIKGIRQGKGYTYYANGALRSVERFKEGKWEREQLYYYPDGTLKSVLPYAQGQLHGEVRLYYPDGQMQRQLSFERGKRQGKEHIWNDSGLLIIEAEFNQDKPIGTARGWYSNGNMAVEAIYIEGSKEPQFREWDEFGSPVPLEKYHGDYFDQVTHQTSNLTTSLEQVFEQVSSLMPLVEQVVPGPDKEATRTSLQKGLAEITEELKKLGEINKRLMYEVGLDPSNPEEAIWKSPSNRKEVEKQVETMTKDMTKGMNDIQGSIAKTIGLLAKKIHQLAEQAKKEKKEKSEPPSEEKPQ